MAARRITQSAINWTAVAERVPENQRLFLGAFKAKSDGYMRRMLANPETAPKIDWAFYKNRVAVKGMVDEFQKQYDAVKVPYPADTVSTQVDAQEKEVEKEIAAYMKASCERIATYEAEAKRLQSLIPYEQMTMEDYRDAFPKEALDPINNPTFWPHTPEEQPGYKAKDAGASGGH